MKKLLVVVIALLLSLSALFPAPTVQAKAGQTETFDFNDLVDKQFLGTHYPGLTFSPEWRAADMSTGWYNTEGYPPHSWPKQVWTGTEGQPQPWSHTGKITFGCPVYEAGGWFCADDGTVYLEAYDQNDVLITSGTVGPNLGSNTYLSVTDRLGRIKYLIIHDTSNYWSMDDFTVTWSNDVYWLAKAIMSESSVGTQAEQIAVGWTVLNRLDSGGFGNSIQNIVKRGYAYNQEPTPTIIALAKGLLGRTILDPTDGATFFFSPRGMPTENEPTKGYDVRGGLQQVPLDGQNVIVWFPSWAKPRTGAEIVESTTRYLTTKNLEWTNLPSIRNWYFMFYRPYP